MKILNNPFVSSKRGLSGLLSPLLGKLGIKAAKSKEDISHGVVIESLGKKLDNQYILMRNMTLEGLEIPIPLILVGPAGLHVLYADGVEGIYRAGGETWEKLDEHTQKFHHARPNLITRTLLVARAVETFIQGRIEILALIEANLLLTNAGTHVEMAHPAVRIVLRDAIERFAISLMHEEPLLNREQVKSIVELITQASGIKTEPEKHVPDVFDLIEEDKPRQPIRPITNARDQLIARKLSRAPFTNRQLIFLGCLAIFNIILLIVFVVIVLILS